MRSHLNKGKENTDKEKNKSILESPGAVRCHSPRPTSHAAPCRASRPHYSAPTTVRPKPRPNSAPTRPSSGSPRNRTAYSGPCPGVHGCPHHRRTREGHRLPCRGRPRPRPKRPVPRRRAVRRRAHPGGTRCRPPRLRHRPALALGGRPIMSTPPPVATSVPAAGWWWHGCGSDRLRCCGVAALMDRDRSQWGGAHRWGSVTIPGRCWNVSMTSHSSSSGS